MSCIVNIISSACNALVGASLVVLSTAVIFSGMWMIKNDYSVSSAIEKCTEAHAVIVSLNSSGLLADLTDADQHESNAASRQTPDNDTDDELVLVPSQPVVVSEVSKDT